MGFHCGNTCSSKLSFHEMKYQKIMARSLPVEVTNGTLEGDIVPGNITFFRLQSTADAKLRAYVAEGEVLPVATKSFGAIGVFAIQEMGRFYRHVLKRITRTMARLRLAIMEKLCLKYSNIWAFPWRI